MKIIDENFDALADVNLTLLKQEIDKMKLSYVLIAEYKFSQFTSLKKAGFTNKEALQIVCSGKANSLE